MERILFGSPVTNYRESGTYQRMSDLSVDMHASIREVNENQWDHVVENASVSSVFHRTGWIRTIEDSLEYDPCHVTVSNRGNPIAIFPNFVKPLVLPESAFIPTRHPLVELVSTKPGFGGPVIISEKRDALELMFDRLERVGGVFLVRHRITTNDLSYIQYNRYFDRLGYQLTSPTCRFRLRLDDWQRINRGMDKERRKNIRRAESLKCTIREVDVNEEQVGRVYREYVSHMDRIGAPVHPPEFFSALRTNMPGRLKIFSVVIDGIDLGSYVFILDDEQSTVHHFFSAIGEPASYEYYPTELLHSKSIRWALDQGYTYYDFGATVPMFDDSIYHYKKQYGAEVVPSLEWVRGRSRVLWRSYRAAKRLFARRADR